VPNGLVVVTGATGAVGPAVVRACLAAGRRVRTFSLDAAPVGLLPAAVEARTGDICDGEAVRSAVAGAQTVVHLAAFLHQFKAAADLDRRFERINVGGTENVMRAATVAGVRRVVFLSTIAVYGPSDGRVIDEHTRPAPDTTYARTKLEAEEIVRSTRSGGESIGTVLRSAAVYGARVKGNYRRLAEAIVRRRFIPLGRGDNRRTLVHDTDVARAAVLAAEHPAAPGRVFNVTDGGIHTLREIIGAIYVALDRKPPRFHVPMRPVLAAAIACEGTCRALGVHPPITRSLLEKYTEDVAVDGTLIAHVLGFEPRVTLEAGWRETVTSLTEVR
jgi:UDP-glucose 4-epimerase